MNFMRLALKKSFERHLRSSTFHRLSWKVKCVDSQQELLVAQGLQQFIGAGHGHCNSFAADLAAAQKKYFLSVFTRH